MSASNTAGALLPRSASVVTVKMPPFAAVLSATLTLCAELLCCQGQIETHGRSERSTQP